MKFTTFEDGFRYELANRDFSRIGMTKLRSRTRERPDADFWGSYARLEEFNRPIYRAACRRMGIIYSTSPATRLRGLALGSAPLVVLPEVLRIAYPRTVEYLEDIRRLRQAGPEREGEFLRYMDEQEEIQVSMMHDALRRDYEACRRRVDDFIADWS